MKGELVGTRVGYAKTRAGKSAALSKVRGDRSDLQENLEAMEAQSAKIAEKLRVAQGNPAAGPIKQGSGQFIWPVNGPITASSASPRPGHLHAGLDIAVAEGTPIRAADSGRVVLMQGVGSSGGYGNFTCVQHNATTSTCYAHQSRFGTSMGANVSKGQVIGYVGNTGHSFGAHLHFEVRVNGTPVNPASYLRRELRSVPAGQALDRPAPGTRRRPPGRNDASTASAHATSATEGPAATSAT